MQTPDPLIGRTIADRYEIVSLIKSGGMGAVYRARQHALERDVAIKLLRPQIVGPSSAARFMAEAHAASRLNHPHVVSVFDFGRTSETEGELLFLVMELVSGLDLDEMLSHVGLLPLNRVRTVLSQTLQALAEAHHFGIVHRDVKPANIILTATRVRADHIKMVDFGIARLQSAKRLTDARTTCGTPAYLAPEIALGQEATPASDLYSAGVLLFELLTGTVPFDFPTVASTLYAHVAHPPPDPRSIAPDREISDALAEVCLRALAKRPEDRFESAQAFELALLDALRDKAVDSRRPSPLPHAAAESARPRSTLAYAPAPERARTAPPADEEPLLGRDADLAWVKEHLRAGTPWLQLTGRPGIGRTRMARAVVREASSTGARVAWVGLDPPPYNELSYRGLRKMIVELAGLSAGQLASAESDAPIEARALEGLRLLFPPGPPRGTNPERTRRLAATALSWAARRACQRSDTGKVVLVLDDLDWLDSASRAALIDQLRCDAPKELTIVSTSESLVEVAGSTDVAARRLTGLARTEAMRLMVKRGANAALPRLDDDIEPLYVEELCRMSGAALSTGVPETLAGLVELRIQALSAAQRKILQATAVAGILRADKLAPLLDRDGESPADSTMPTVTPLLDGAFLRVDDRELSIRHRMVGRVALSRTPSGAVAAIHAFAADHTPSTPAWQELRAHHRIRGVGDFASFLAVEEAARTRTNFGDGTGAIAALWQAVTTARMQIMRGDAGPATSALSVFGRKLATALLVEGRHDDARIILQEILDATEPDELDRALVLEQLAAVEQVCGHPMVANRHRREALRVAQSCGDRDVSDRLAAFLGSAAPELAPRHLRQPVAPSGRRPVLVVDDDRAIREGLQAVIRSDGRDAFAAANGAEALQLLQKIPRPGLILLDLMMPVMTGWELMETLRRDDDLTDIPVVVVSAVSKRREPGAMRVIQKPVEANALLDIVQEFCD